MSQLAALSALAGTHDYDPPDIYQVFADFGRNPLGDDRAGWLGLVHIVSSDEIATDLFIAKAAGVMEQKDAIKEWAYMQAVDFVGARASDQRRVSMVGAYRTDWGHQAARDGVALALWGGQHPDLIYNGAYVFNQTGWCEVPGVCARAKQFGCTKEAYQRVRDEVGSRANDLITEAAHWLGMCRSGKFSGEFIRRWECAMDKPWPGV